MKLLFKYMPDVKKRLIATLLLLSFTCCIFLGVRVYLTHKITYIFLLWNLFLGLIPLYAAYKSYLFQKQYPGRYFLIAFMIMFWLAFFPNAPYIITDFIHLHDRFPVPLWFDAILVFSFAMTGLLSAVVSMYFIHLVVLNFVNDFTGWLLILFFCFLSGYGIYLGRVQRWNTWDILVNPMELIGSGIKDSLNLTAGVMTLSVGTIVLLSYFLFFNIISSRRNELD